MDQLRALNPLKLAIAIGLWIQLHSKFNHQPALDHSHRAHSCFAEPRPSLPGPFPRWQTSEPKGLLKGTCLGVEAVHTFDGIRHPTIILVFRKPPLHDLPVRLERLRTVRSFVGTAVPTVVIRMAPTEACVETFGRSCPCGMRASYHPAIRVHPVWSLSALADVRLSRHVPPRLVPGRQMISP